MLNRNFNSGMDFGSVGMKLLTLIKPNSMDERVGDPGDQEILPLNVIQTNSTNEVYIHTYMLTYSMMICH